MIVDTSALLAFFDDREPDHDAVVEVIASTSELLVVPPYVVAEFDYMVAKKHGTAAELAALGDLAGGAWDLPTFGIPDVKQARTVIEKYRDQDIGVTDASIVVLADRYATRTITTLDRRHFDVVRPIKGGKFSVLPR
ncbi:MAG: PIN domain-containing protein [Thermocrispum sp.]